MAARVGMPFPFLIVMPIGMTIAFLPTFIPLMLAIKPCWWS